VPWPAVELLSGEITDGGGDDALTVVGVMEVGQGGLGGGYGPCVPSLAQGVAPAAAIKDR